MPASLAFPALAVAALCSVAMMWSGVKDASFSATAWSAAAFAAVVVLVALQLNMQKWSADNPGTIGERQLKALRRNGQLSAIVYAWGALAMVAMYKFAGLYWQHGLQYASGMLLFAAIIFGWTHYARPGERFATPQWLQRAKRLNLLHGGAAAVAAVIFLASGKLWVDRPDWAANIVFLAGGVSIVALCALAALTSSRIAAQA